MSVQQDVVRSGFLAESEFLRRLARRKAQGQVWQVVFLVAVLFGVVMLATLLVDIVLQSASWVVVREEVNRRGQIETQLMADFPLLEGWRQRAEIQAGLQEGERFGLH
ncbi:MAG: hypothetical protein D6775_05160, partial [Caldilineae bacterium]